jgi:predicted nuclease of predicted toxin-antitoxin system
LRFLIDNALSPSMAEGLRKAGHEAIHVCELGMGTATDKKIMNYALTDNRVIVSADTDFGTLFTLQSGAIC